MEQVDLGSSMSMLGDWFSTCLQSYMSFNGRIFQQYASIQKSNLYGVQQIQLNPHMIPTLHLSILLLIATTSSFRFTLTDRQPSFSMQFDTIGKQTFSAISSGEQNHEIMILIQYSKMQTNTATLLLNKTSSDVEYTHQYEPGRLNVTLISTTGTGRNVSFDFYSEDDPLVKMIDKRDIRYVEEVLTSVFKGLTDVSRNQQFHIERDESHKGTLESSESSIKWTGIIKILFLLSSALIQLWIMKGFFKSNTHSYQPVEMH